MGGCRGRPDETQPEALFAGVRGRRIHLGTVAAPAGGESLQRRQFEIEIESRGAREGLAVDLDRQAVEPCPTVSWHQQTKHDVGRICGHGEIDPVRLPLRRAGGAARRHVVEGHGTGRPVGAEPEPGIPACHLLGLDVPAEADALAGDGGHRQRGAHHSK
jgi:hypothetical protein